jgi:hypothetical protein
LNDAIFIDSGTMCAHLEAAEKWDLRRRQHEVGWLEENPPPQQEQVIETLHKLNVDGDIDDQLTDIEEESYSEDEYNLNHEWINKGLLPNDHYTFK